MLCTLLENSNASPEVNIQKGVIYRSRQVHFSVLTNPNRKWRPRNETGVEVTKLGLGNNRRGQKISNDPHEFTCACGDLFLMHDTPVVHQLGTPLIGKLTACYHLPLLGLDGKF